MLRYEPVSGHFFSGNRRVGFTGDKDGYVRVRFQGKTRRAHRVAWFLTYGYWPKEVDHINGKPSDNRLVNLREGTHQFNMQNRNIQSNNTSGVLGIYPDRGRWRAAITVNGTRKFLGTFKTREEAVVARHNAEHTNCRTRGGPCHPSEPSTPTGDEKVDSPRNDAGAMLLLER